MDNDITEETEETEITNYHVILEFSQHSEENIQDPLDQR
ncbi:hypothetical protein C900_05292 [Fulvivirga imtechensis AK7]|uniref:Uncharacterized protein n=1 Tax=Fulvivirga imtechensis AK7 TaxID=1237149 RepID=L8JJY7_9BACT|nr:hypothetical protein C900_05292 [Fulvivirga imtechensis AK7]